MEYEYLTANSGEKLYKEEEIINYILYVDATLADIRKTVTFGEEFANGNLDKYYEIEKSLQLKAPDGTILNNSDIYNSLTKKSSMSPKI